MNRMDNFAYKIEFEPSEFLNLSPEIVKQYLENDKHYFDYLKKDISALILRKLTEFIKFFNKTSDAEIVEIFKSIQEVIYESIETVGKPEFLKGFSEEEIVALISETTSIELTEGCSVACSFCGFDAKPKVRGHLPFKDLVYFARNFSSHLTQTTGDFLLYHASEPLDYEDDDKNYLDVVELFHFYGVKPFTSTAYPKGKSELLKSLLEKDYIDRISVTQQNLERLKKDELIIEDEKGKMSSSYDAVQRGLERDWEEVSGPLYKIEKRDNSAGRAFEETKEASIGGIECETGIILRRDGFYNDAVCLPTKEHRTGVILEKVEPKNLSHPLSKDNLPEKVDELIKYGIVEKRLVYGEQNFTYLVMYNFQGEKNRKYFVEYDAKSLVIEDFEEIREQDEPDYLIYLGIKQRIDVVSLWQKPQIVSLISEIMPKHIDVTKMDKAGPYYKKMLETCREFLEDFITNQDLDTENLGFYGDKNLSTLSTETKFERDELTEVVMSFRNAFTLVREAVSGITPRKIDEAEKKFMTELREKLLHRLNFSRQRMSYEDRVSSREFIKSLF